MELRYQQLSSANVESAHEILRLCGLDMQERLGLNHWVPPYSLEKLRWDAENRQVYAVLYENQVIATFTLGTALPRSYQKIPAILEMWNTPQPSALYINHLAILPSFQGRGLGRQCVQMIEGMGTILGCDVIRLDAYSRHAGLQIFYPKLGFLNVGRFSLWSERLGKVETTCYEKHLVPQVSSTERYP